MIEVKGKGNIVARIVADSVSSVDGKRITTFELEYMRFVHAEFMTHRLFSRNAASSRAIPVVKMLELVKNNPAMPIHWGKNQAGMQANEECDNLVFTTLEMDNAEYFGEVASGSQRQSAWQLAAYDASEWAKGFSEAGYHKQIVNRLLEPFQMIKVVCSATEFDNFFYLRYHKDAQPEIAELARCMWEAREQSVPVMLNPGEWHVPYVEFDVISRGYFLTKDNGDQEWLSDKNALKVSASCCAQVSYRKQDDSLEKAEDIYDKLINSKPCHASPVEHSATPMPLPCNEHWHVDGSNGWVDGVTHVDKEGSFWSGNFKGWIQHRQLITGHTCWKFEKENNNE